MEKSTEKKRKRALQKPSCRACACGCAFPFSRNGLAGPAHTVSTHVVSIKVSCDTRPLVRAFDSFSVWPRGCTHPLYHMLIHPSSRGSCPFVQPYRPLSPHSLPPTNNHQPRPYVVLNRGAFIQLTSVATPAVSSRQTWVLLFELSSPGPQWTRTFTGHAIHSQLLSSTSSRSVFFEVSSMA